MSDTNKAILAAKSIYGESLDECPNHPGALVYHVDDFFGDGSALEGCWDCPQKCGYHIHEPLGMPWTPVGTGKIDRFIAHKMSTQ